MILLERFNPHIGLVFLLICGCGQMSDSQRLQGKWVPVEAVGQEGGRESKEALAKRSFTFSGNKLTSHIKDGRFEDIQKCTFDLDSSNSPRIIIFTFPLDARHGAGKTSRGIYQFEGDQVRMMMPNEPDLPAPRDFVPRQDGLYTLWVLKPAP